MQSALHRLNREVGSLQVTPEYISRVDGLVFQQGLYRTVNRTSVGFRKPTCQSVDRICCCNQFHFITSDNSLRFAPNMIMTQTQYSNFQFIAHNTSMLIYEISHNQKQNATIGNAAVPRTIIIQSKIPFHHDRLILGSRP